MAINDKSIRAEVLVHLYENKAEASSEIGEKASVIVIENPARVVEMVTKIGSAAVFRTPVAASSTADEKSPPFDIREF